MQSSRERDFLVSWANVPAVIIIASNIEATAVRFIMVNLLFLNRNPLYLVLTFKSEISFISTETLSYFNNIYDFHKIIRYLSPN